MKKGRMDPGTWLLILVGVALLVVGLALGWAYYQIDQFMKAHTALVSDAAAYRAEVEGRIIAIARSGVDPWDKNPKEARNWISGRITRLHAREPLLDIIHDLDPSNEEEREKRRNQAELHALEDLRNILQQLRSFEGELKDPKKMPQNPEALESRSQQFAFIKAELGKALKQFETTIRPSDAGG